MIKSGDSPSTFRIGAVSPWMLCSSGLHSIKMMLTCLNVPEECNQAGNRTGRCHLWKEAEDTCVVVWRKEDWVALCNFLRKGSAEGRAGLCPLGTNNKTYRNGTKLCQESFKLDIRKKLFVLRAVKHRTDFLVIWLVLHTCHYSRAIRTDPLRICFKFWLAPEWSDSWTRWSL